MAADAKAVLCFTEHCSSIWNHRSNLKAICWHANYITVSINTNCWLRRGKERKKEDNTSQTIETLKCYYRSTAIIFLPVILAPWTHGGGGVQGLWHCVIGNRPNLKLQICYWGKWKQEKNREEVFDLFQHFHEPVTKLLSHFVCC